MPSHRLVAKAIPSSHHQGRGVSQPRLSEVSRHEAGFTAGHGAQADWANPAAVFQGAASHGAITFAPGYLSPAVRFVAELRRHHAARRTLDPREARTPLFGIAGLLVKPASGGLTSNTRLTHAAAQTADHAATPASAFHAKAPVSIRQSSRSVNP